MMDIRKTRTCERCKNVVLLDQVRLYPKGENKNFLVCTGCCEELKKASAGQLPETKVAKVTVPSSYVKYNCSRCNYVFKADSSKAGLMYNLNCPYCGKADRLEHVRSKPAVTPNPTQKLSPFSERKL